jgi:hypothetical protein
VRQLRNIVERLVVTIPRAKIDLADLPPALLQSGKPKHAFVITPDMTLAQVEAELIRQTLLKVTSNRAAAAQKLGISRRALQYKIRRYGLNQLPKTQMFAPVSIRCVKSKSKKQRQGSGGLDRFCADIDQALAAVREMK